MIKINLNEYKESKVYFNLFDKIIKEKNISKEIFLQDNNINPSTYRRCKKEECNVGMNIIIKLCELLNYKYLDNNQIDELEQLLNNIYSDMYYKIYKNYDDYLEQIDKYINENESFDYTKLGIYMTCKYHYNKKEYDELYDSLIKEQNEKHIIFINNINELLTNKTKKVLKNIKELGINDYLYKFFENYAFS